MQPVEVTSTIWGLWIISWIVSAFWSDRAVKRPALRDEWVYRILTVAAVYLLFSGTIPGLRVGYRLWALGPAADWTLCLVVVAGLGFAWWARICLGRLWSSRVTQKADHRIVDSGPYAHVRHPIYTGILLAAAATAAQLGTAWAIAGLLAFWFAFWSKARLEERFLSEQLGAADYADYRRRVPMLIPLGPRG